jgi:hypothetical protein
VCSLISEVHLQAKEYIMKKALGFAVVVGMVSMVFAGCVGAPPDPERVDSTEQASCPCTEGSWECPTNGFTAFYPPCTSPLPAEERCQAHCNVACINDSGC